MGTFILSVFSKSKRKEKRSTTTVSIFQGEAMQ